MSALQITTATVLATVHVFVAGLFFSASSVAGGKLRPGNPLDPLGPFGAFAFGANDGTGAPDTSSSSPPGGTTTVPEPVSLSTTAPEPVPGTRVSEPVPGVRSGTTTLPEFVSTTAPEPVPGTGAAMIDSDNNNNNCDSDVTRGAVLMSQREDRGTIEIRIYCGVI